MSFESWYGLSERLGECVTFGHVDGVIGGFVPGFNVVFSDSCTWGIVQVDMWLVVSELVPIWFVAYYGDFGSGVGAVGLG